MANDNDGLLLLLLTVVVFFDDVDDARIGVLFVKEFGDRIVVVVVVDDVVDVHFKSAALFSIRKCAILSLLADDNVDGGDVCGRIKPLAMFNDDEFCVTVVEDDDDR